MERKKSASSTWFVCKFCSRAFTARIKLKVHKKKEHFEQCVKEKSQINQGAKVTTSQSSNTAAASVTKTILGSDERIKSNVGGVRAELDVMENEGWKSSSAEPANVVEGRGRKIKLEDPGTAYDVDSEKTGEPRGWNLCPAMGSSSDSLSDHAIDQLFYKDLKTEGYCEVTSRTVSATDSISEEMRFAEDKSFGSSLEYQEGGLLSSSENQDDCAVHPATETGAMGLRDRRAQLVSKYLQKSDYGRRTVNSLHPSTLLQQFQNRPDAEKRLRNHQCPHCPLAFIFIVTYHRHIREVHSDQLCTTSATIPWQTGRQQKKDGHSASASTKLPPEQQQAESVQLTAESLTSSEPKPPDQLISNASPQNYSCTVCDQTFRRLESLKSHIRLKHPPKEAAEVTQPDVLEVDLDADSTNTQTVNEGRTAEERNDGDLLKFSKKKTPTARVAPMRISGNDSALGFGFESSDSSKIDRILDKKLHQSLLRSRLGYKCCKCVRYFNSRVALIRHYCEDHPSLFSSDVPRITSVTSLAAKESSQSATANSNAEKGSRALKQNDTKNDRKIIQRQEINGKLFSKCSYCSKLISYKVLRRHERIHTGGNPFRCSLCPESFRKADWLKTHQKTVHGSDSTAAQISGDFHCSLCDYVTSLRHNFRRHLSRRHNVDFSAALIPLERMVIGSSPTAAQNAGQKIQNSTRNSKSATHHPQKTVHSSNSATAQISTDLCCSLCDYVTSVKNNFMKHARRRHNVCYSAVLRQVGTSVSSAIALMAVQKSQKSTRKSESSTTPCHPSPAIPANRAKAVAFEPSEASGRLKCPYCPKLFLKITFLRIHIRKHTGEKPYACSFCSEKFHRKDYLQRHQLRSHPIVGKSTALSTDCTTSKKRELGSAVKNECHRSGKAERKSSTLHSAALESPATTKPALTTQTFLLRSSQSQLEPVPCTSDVQTANPSESKISKSTSTAKLYCRYCSKFCKGPTCLRDHESIHTGQQLYSCSQCSRPFRFLSSALRHEKNVHKIQESRATSCELNASLPKDDSELSEPVVSGNEEEPSGSPDVIEIDSESSDKATVQLDQAEDSYTCILCDDGQEFIGPLESVKSHVVKKHKVSPEKAVKFLQ